MRFDFQKFERQLQQLMADQHIPGLAVAIVKDESIIYTQGFGLTSVEEGGVPVTPGALFRIGSTSKPLTGALIMRLAEAGKLSLDEPVKTYLPDFRLSDPAAENSVTVRQILSHSAGLPSDFSLHGSRDPGGLAEHIRSDFPGYRLVAPPGKVFQYSNPGINLAGRLAEAVTGRTYNQLMDEYIFQPLEMMRSTFDLTVAATWPLALNHQVNAEGQLITDHWMIDNTAYNPSGLGFSSALDLANFAVMQMNGGIFKGQQVLNQASVHEMQRIQTPIYGLASRSGVESVQRIGYGLTFFIAELEDTRWVSHPGGIGSYVVFFEMIPAGKIACILLANGGAVGFDAGDLFDPIFAAAMRKPVTPAPITEIEPDRAQWEGYTGNYSGDNGLIRITESGGRLQAEINGVSLSLMAVAKDLYIGKTRPEDKYRSIGFIPERRGVVEYIVADGNIFRRTENLTIFRMDANQLERYAGLYHNGIAGDFEVRRNGEQLLFRLVKIDKSEPYIPLDETRFTGSFGPLVFELDETGSPRSFNINNTHVFTRVEKDA
jgi:CubicO group peptidase (beta-lactamase class C family)